MSGVIREVEFPIFSESHRGKLVPVEFDSAIPFVVKRLYYIWGVPVGVVRGGHAHTLEQEFFVCVRGKCTLKASTDGGELHKIVLRTSNRGVFVDSLVWHEFTDFSPDAILLCFSSTTYLPDNYITDFQKFQEIKQSS
jgi:dTDP-4-dehydrorhamnose 3,5-epimerase-like enzyme